MVNAYLDFIKDYRTKNKLSQKEAIKKIKEGDLWNKYKQQNPKEKVCETNKKNIDTFSGIKPKKICRKICPNNRSSTTGRCIKTTEKGKYNTTGKYNMINRKKLEQMKKESCKFGEVENKKLLELKEKLKNVEKPKKSSYNIKEFKNAEMREKKNKKSNPKYLKIIETYNKEIEEFNKINEPFLKIMEEIQILEFKKEYAPKCKEGEKKKEDKNERSKLFKDFKKIYEKQDNDLTKIDLEYLEGLKDKLNKPRFNSMYKKVLKRFNKKNKIKKKAEEKPKPTKKEEEEFKPKKTGKLTYIKFISELKKNNNSYTNKEIKEWVKKEDLYKKYKDGDLNVLKNKPNFKPKKKEIEEEEPVFKEEEEEEEPKPKKEVLEKCEENYNVLGQINELYELLEKGSKIKITNKTFKINSLFYDLIINPYRFIYIKENEGNFSIDFSKCKELILGSGYYSKDKKERTQKELQDIYIEKLNYVMDILKFQNKTNEKRESDIKYLIKSNKKEFSKEQLEKMNERLKKYVNSTKKEKPKKQKKEPTPKTPSKPKPKPKPKIKVVEFEEEEEEEVKKEEEIKKEEEEKQLISELDIDRDKFYDLLDSSAKGGRRGTAQFIKQYGKELMNDIFGGQTFGDFYSTPQKCMKNERIEGIIKQGENILEGTAGLGSLVHFVNKTNKQANITGNELNNRFVNFMKDEFKNDKNITITNDNFLEKDYKYNKFDTILLNPPFSNQGDKTYYIDFLFKGANILLNSYAGNFMKNMIFISPSITDNKNNKIGDSVLMENIYKRLNSNKKFDDIYEKYVGKKPNKKLYKYLTGKEVNVSEEEENIIDKEGELLDEYINLYQGEIIGVCEGFGGTNIKAYIYFFSIAYTPLADKTEKPKLPVKDNIKLEIEEKEEDNIKLEIEEKEEVKQTDLIESDIKINDWFETAGYEKIDYKGSNNNLHIVAFNENYKNKANPHIYIELLGRDDFEKPPANKGVAREILCKLFKYLVKNKTIYEGEKAIQGDSSQEYKIRLTPEDYGDKDVKHNQKKLEKMYRNMGFKKVRKTDLNENQKENPVMEIKLGKFFEWCESKYPNYDKKKQIKIVSFDSNDDDEIEGGNLETEQRIKWSEDDNKNYNFNYDILEGLIDSYNSDLEINENTKKDLCSDIHIIQKYITKNGLLLKKNNKQNIIEDYQELVKNFKDNKNVDCGGKIHKHLEGSGFFKNYNYRNNHIRKLLVDIDDNIKSGNKEKVKRLIKQYKKHLEKINNEDLKNKLKLELKKFPNY